MDKQTTGKILVISGPSGCGKGTVIDCLLTDGFGVKAVSFTTRKIRSGEVEGRDYYFITKTKFKSLLRRGEILEYTFFNGNYYGTPRHEIDRLLQEGHNPILDITYDGAFHVREMYPEAILCFLIPPNVATQEQRLRGRGTQTEESILERLEAARNELTYAPQFDCVIVNEDNAVAATAEKLKDLIRGILPDQSEVPDLLAHYFDR